MVKNGTILKFGNNSEYGRTFYKSLENNLKITGPRNNWPTKTHESAQEENMRVVPPD